MTITLEGEPRSTSHIYKHTCRGGFASVYMSEQGKELKEDYKWQIVGQYRGKPLDCPLVVRAVFYFGTKRSCDIDNFNKLAFDACTELIWEDDSQIEELHLKKKYDKENPRIVLTIEPLNK